MAAETQVLRNDEKKYIAKFFSDAAESSVKKIDVSTLAWAKHTLTLNDAASPNFKIGEVITVGSAETFLVTDFTAGASTVTVVVGIIQIKKQLQLIQVCLMVMQL